MTSICRTQSGAVATEHDSLQAGTRRTVSTAADTDYYYRRACTERVDFLRALLTPIARCWRAWDCIKKKMEGQSARRQLSALSIHELKDLGLARGDLDAIANGTYATDPTRCARSRKRLGKYT